jgi:tetratricopeptide (TPR) repeat protein
LGNKEGIATLKNNISNIYSMKKEYGPAMKYLDESYQLLVELGDKSRIVGSMNNMGNLNMDLQLYEKAMKNYSEAYQLSKQNNLAFSDPLNNMGTIFFRQGNYPKALEAYSQALEIERSNNNRLGVLNTCVNLGMTYIKAGNQKEAQKYLGEARSLAGDLQAYSYMPAILRSSSELLAAQGRHREAYQTMVKYDSLREKIYGEESTRKIAQMEMVQDFQAQEKQLEMLKKEDEIKTLQLRNSRLFIVMVILVILVALGVINFYFMGNRRKLFGRSA